MPSEHVLGEIQYRDLKSLIGEPGEFDMRQAYAVCSCGDAFAHNVHAANIRADEIAALMVRHHFQQYNHELTTHP